MSQASDRAVGQFLRARRSSFDPERLPPSLGQRRVQGLRREELAAMAGVSASYYTRIEQGAVRASASVLDALARALELGSDDREHLHRLARSLPAEWESQDRDHRGISLPERGLELMVRQLQNTPAAVLDADTTVLTWNRSAHQVFANHLSFDAPWDSPSGVNWARELFLHPGSRELFAHWEVVAHDLVGRLRFAQAADPADVSLTAVVQDLQTKSPDFARLWESHPVRERALGHNHLRHPVLGDLLVRDTVLRSTSSPRQILIVFTSEPESETERRLASAGRLPS